MAKPGKKKKEPWWKRVYRKYRKEKPLGPETEEFAKRMMERVMAEREEKARNLASVRKGVRRRKRERKIPRYWEWVSPAEGKCRKIFWVRDRKFPFFAHFRIDAKNKIIPESIEVTALFVGAERESDLLRKMSQKEKQRFVEFLQSKKKIFVEG